MNTYVKVNDYKKMYLQNAYEGHSVLLFSCLVIIM